MPDLRKTKQVCLFTSAPRLLSPDGDHIYRECPADLKEGISSLIFAAPRCSETPELAAIRKLFEKKYGKDFVSAAIELRPNCGVNRMVKL